MTDRERHLNSGIEKALMKTLTIGLSILLFFVGAHAIAGEADFSEVESKISNSFCAESRMSSEHSDAEVSNEISYFRFKELYREHQQKLKQFGCDTPGCQGVWSNQISIDVAQARLDRDEKILAELDAFKAKKILDPSFPGLAKQVDGIEAYHSLYAWISKPNFHQMPKDLSSKMLRNLFSSDAQDQKEKIASFKLELESTSLKTKEAEVFLKSHPLSDSAQINRANLSLYEARNIPEIDRNDLTSLPGGFQDCGMDEAEIDALEAYTSDSIYLRMNRALRQPSVQMAFYAPFVRILKSALGRLHPYQGLVHRKVNLSADQRKRYANFGAIVEEREFLSTSIGRGFGGDFEMTIQSKTGRFIAPFSHAYNEHEVLFPPGCSFRVLNSSENSVELEETSCPNL